MRHMRAGSLAAAIFLAVTSTAPVTAADSSAAQCLALLSENKIADAEAVCTRAADESREGKLLHGDYLRLAGDKKGAVKRYGEALGKYDRDNPSDFELAVLRRRARTYFELQDRFSAGFDTERYLEHKSDDVEMLQLGVVASSANEKRLSYIEKLISMQPGNVEPMVWKARILIEAGKAREAVVAADEALKLDPKSDLALSMRGFAYSALGEHAKAVRDHSTVAKRLPNDPQPRVNRGEALLGAKRFPEAIAAATEALALDPNRVEALALRYNARMSVGDGEGALADIEAAAKIDPSLDVSDARHTAEWLVDAHGALNPASIKQMETDRVHLLAYVRSHLQSICGYYRVPTYEDNVNLDAYRDCVLEWAENDTGKYEMNPGEDVMTMGDRFMDTANWIERAKNLRCSNMPKKSRCIADSLYARAQAANDGMDNPKVLIGNAEFDRLNAEVASYNASVKRQNALATTANFLEALANELSKQ